ncbi:MAG: hypothetical protein AB1422_17220, partial [bacterium]
IPKRAFMYNDWYGMGWIILDPYYGYGLYVICGVLQGGMTTEYPRPNVWITSPANNSYYLVGEAIDCTAQAYCDECGEISDDIVWSAVEELADGGQYNFPDGSGPTYSINPPGPGHITIDAKITCPHGNDVDSIHETVFKVKITDCNLAWLPEKDNTTNFTANIIPDDVKGIITFTLSGVSDEPGYCLNAGKQSTADKDLKFEANKNPLFNIRGNGAIAESKQEVNTIDVIVSSFDYGSYGEIKAEATVQNKTAESEIKNIPRDDDNNYIADVWSYNAGNATDDDDNVPPEGTLGDGLSRYEEYRGFLVSGVHIRTSPERKDVFIYDENGIYPQGNFTAATGMSVHYQITAAEFNGVTSRVVNFNYETAHIVDQHGLYLRNYDIEGDTGVAGVDDYHEWGVSFGPNGPPKNHPEIRCDVEQVRWDENWDRPDGANDRANDAVMHNITHELGHGISIAHHDPPTGGDTSCAMRYLWDEWDLYRKPHLPEYHGTNDADGWNTMPIGVDFCSHCKSQFEVSDK